MGEDLGLRLDVLGPTALRRTRAGAAADHELTVSQRRLLARLALEPPAAVGLAALAEAIWPDAAPDHARATIQNQVSRIRAAYADAVIVTVQDGYALGVPTDAAALRDGAARAETLLEEGSVPAAFKLADSVLGLGSGTPYADLGHVTAAVPPRRSLIASRRAAQNTRLTAALALGRIGWALAEAERLAGESPHDEMRQALLARALAAAGRRGDALATIAATRRRLRTELGIDAGPLLAGVESNILHPQEAPVALSRLEFTGRDVEVRRVLGAFAAGRVVEVTGEPGAGVTRLLLEVASHLIRLGVRPVRVGALDHLDSATGVLEEVLGEAGLVAGSSGVVAGFAAAVRAAALETPIAILVDDAPALGPTARAAILAAAAGEHVSAAFGGHGRPTGDEHERVELSGLDRDAVARLAVAHSAEVPTAAAIDALVARSGGNPLVLGILLSGSEPAEAPADGSSHLVALARSHLLELAPRQRAMAERVAVAGEGFPAAALGDPADLPASLVSVFGGGAVEFRHGALGDAIYADLPPARREELHAELGRAAAAAGATPAIVARHLLAAGALAPAEAVTAAREAAAQSARVGAHKDAVDWLERALAVRSLEPGIELALRIRLGDEQRLAGDPEHLQTLVSAVEDAIASGDEELVSDAGFALLQLGGTTSSGSISEETAVLVERMLGVVRTPRLRAPVCAAASLAWSMTGDAARSRAFFDEGEALASDDETRARVLPFAYMALGMPVDLARRRTLSGELRAIGTRLDDPAARFEGAQQAFSVGLVEGDGEEVRRAVAEMSDLAEQIGDVGRRWALQWTRAAIAHLDGDDERSERLTEEAAALFGPVSGSRAFAVQSGQLLGLRLTQGRLAELADVLEWLVTEQPGVPAWHAAFAAAAHAAGRDREIVDQHASRALTHTQEDFTWLAAHVIGARAVAGTGNAGLAATYAERLAPWSGLGVFQGTCSYGPVDTALALLHRVLGDAGAAGRHADRARDFCRRLAAPAFAAELGALGL